MAKKKKSQTPEANGASSAPPSNGAAKTEPVKAQSPSLIISRNKHWRYISSFHGPWLQLTIEALESLAHTNYFSPRPHPIDPAVFYDVLKIRKAVDEAASLAVRAASGVAASSLHTNNGLYGGAGQLLGFGLAGGGAEAKLSKERKYRMRELATKKLSLAYQFDEVATSVATMQSASSLDDVAGHVLQRNASDPDAKYVHFFHEKIPARMMAEYTSLQPLDEVIISKPMHGSSYRTRALTRLFKSDWDGAARDLTAGLHECRALQAQHMIGKDQLVLASEVNGHHSNHDRGRLHHAVLEEADQPLGLEAQLLFHRATVYFEIASQHVEAALDGLEEWQDLKSNPIEQAWCEQGGLDLTATPEAKMAHRRRLEARKVVKTNAKRALKDVMAFLDRLDYTPRLSQEVTEEFFRRVNVAANGNKKQNNGPSSHRYLEAAHETNTTGPSDALIVSKKSNTSQNTGAGWPSLPPLRIYKASDLFQPTPIPDLPPFPAERINPSSNPIAEAVAESSESITYHPLLTDALHILLLSHALLQTSSKELLRHAHNVARLARICDGYPIFLAPRSPARADWVEVLRRTNNWIGIQSPWEKLCSPAPLYHPSNPQPTTNGLGSSTALTTASSTRPPEKVSLEQEKESEEKKRERITQMAIMGALGDARVVDEESFDRSVRARLRRAEEDEKAGVSTPGSSAPVTGLNEQNANGNARSPVTAASGRKEAKRWAQEDGKEYPISTERADSVARWVKEAPLHIDGAKKKARKLGKEKIEAGDGRATPSSTGGLEESVEALTVDA